MTARGRKIWRTLATAGSAALLVSLLGFLATDLSPWYYALRKPGWQPPDWLFGPVWTVIFALAALSGVFAWRNRRQPGDQLRIIGPFVLNAVLNVFWSWLFFTRHRPDLALFEVVWLWLSIVMVCWAVWPMSHAAAWLLLPYLAWVAFAAFLNLTIVHLNAPFTAA